jgi:hypothetical protein
MPLSAITNAQRLDWPGWWLGIMRSFISGAAGAVTATGTVGYVDPKDWGTGNLPHMLLLASLTFFGVGLVHLAAFLQTHPTPDPIKP